MRSLLLNLHLYTGLLCSSYLVIFGVSSLNYNHHFGDKGEEKVEWERTISLPELADKQALAAAVRDSLDLIGWPHRWTVRWSDDVRERLVFRMGRPGKLYDLRVSVNGANSRVVAVETRTGFWAVVNQLHGLMRLPNSSFMSWWGVYT